MMEYYNYTANVKYAKHSRTITDKWSFMSM